MKYLDFENQEKKYRPFKLNSKNIRENIGKQIVYLRECDVDKYRGFVFPRFGILKGVKYSQVFLDNDDSIDKRDVIECGIKI